MQTFLALATKKKHTLPCWLITTAIALAIHTCDFAKLLKTHWRQRCVWLLNSNFSSLHPPQAPPVCYTALWSAPFLQKQTLPLIAIQLVIAFQHNWESTAQTRQIFHCLFFSKNPVQLQCIGVKAKKILGTYITVNLGKKNLHH